MYHVHTWHHLVYLYNGHKKFGKRRSSSVAGIFSTALDFFSHSQFFFHALDDSCIECFWIQAQKQSHLCKLGKIFCGGATILQGEWAELARVSLLAGYFWIFIFAFSFLSWTEIC